MLKLIIRLSALSLGISCVMCSSSSETQLASLNERLSQVLSKLYASPLISTKPSAAETEEASNVSPEYPHTPDTSYVVSSGSPQVVYVSPSPYLESGAQPNDDGYAIETHPVTRSTWNYPYAPDLSPPKYSSYPSARSYAEIQRFAFPTSPYPSPVPFHASLLPSVAPPFPYSQSYTSVPQSPLQFSSVSPFSYPTTCPSPVPLTGFPSSLSFPSLGSPVFPSSPPAPYTSLGTSSFPTLPSLSYPSTASPGLPAFPSPSYPSLASSGFSALPSPPYTSLGSPGLPTFSSPSFPSLGLSSYPALQSPSYPTFRSSGFSALPSPTLPPYLLSLIPNSPSIPTPYPSFTAPGNPSPLFSSPTQFSPPEFPKLNELHSSVAPPFPNSQPYTSILQSPLQFSPVSPFTTPTTCPSIAPLTGFPSSLNFPSLGSPGFPSSPPASYTSLGTSSFPTLPSPSYPSKASPGLPAFPSPSYPSLASSGFSALTSTPYTSLGSPGLPTFPFPSFPSLGLSSYPALQPPSYPTFKSFGFSALPSPTLPPSLSSLIPNSPSIPTPYPSFNAPGNPSPVFSSPSQFSPPSFPKLNEFYSYK